MKLFKLAARVLMAAVALAVVIPVGILAVVVVGLGFVFDSFEKKHGVVVTLLMEIRRQMDEIENNDALPKLLVLGSAAMKKLRNESTAGMSKEMRENIERMPDGMKIIVQFMGLEVCRLVEGCQPDLVKVI